MGEPQMKKYDIETWMPSRNGYGETMSNSIMGDFQTRRLNIKYRKKDGTKEYCFSSTIPHSPLPHINCAFGKLSTEGWIDSNTESTPPTHRLTSIPVVKQL